MVEVLVLVQVELPELAGATEMRVSTRSMGELGAGLLRQNSYSTLLFSFFSNNGFSAHSHDSSSSIGCISHDSSNHNIQWSPPPKRYQTNQYELRVRLILITFVPSFQN